MLINTDINILGGLPDLNLISHFLFSNKNETNQPTGHYSYTAIKTDKSVKRFEKAITGTLLHFESRNVALLVNAILSGESISYDSLLVLFWNASKNNELFHYLNTQLFFPAFYSGRLLLKKEEVGACIKELKHTEDVVKQWTNVTIETVARKYLTLLKKFNLMEGGRTKKILHPYLNDKMFVLFIYWFTATEVRPNLLESEWLSYGFSEHPIFIERVLQKKFSPFFHLSYTGDKLKIDTTIPYADIYEALK